MTDTARALSSISLFESLQPEELATVAELAQPVGWQAGQDVYGLGDPGGSMFAVVEGAVELFGIVSGVEKLFMTVRDRGVFGLLSVLDSGDRPGNARALEDTTALVLEREAVERLLAEQPAIGIKLLQGIGRALGQRVRLLTEQFDATVAWNLEVTGLTSLNLEQVMSERIEVTVETVRGEPLRGTLLRFEQSVAGHELYLKSRDGRIHVLPYHAIVRLSIDGGDVEDRPDTPTF